MILRGIRRDLLPENGAPLLAKEYRNFLIAIANAVSNLRLIAPTINGDTLDADVKITEMGLIITLPAPYGGVGGGSLELTDGTTDLTGVQKITVAGGVVSGTSPNAILTIAGGGLKQFAFKANTGSGYSGSAVDAGDFWWAKTWDGTTLGSTFVKIAKPYKISSQIMTETFGGVTHTYTYSRDAYNRLVRSNTWSGGTEAELIQPDAIDGDVFYALPFSTTSPGDLVGVTLLDVNADGRAWAI